MYDLTNCFYYTLPTLLNIILLLFWAQNGGGKNLFSGRTPFFSGMLLLLFYLAIFSNLFCSYLLAIHVFFCLAEDIWKSRKTFSIGLWLKKNGFHLLVAFLFLTALVFDANGARANSMQTGFALAETIAILAKRAYYVKKIFLLLALLLFAAALLLLYRGKGRGEKDPSSAALIRLLAGCACRGALSLVYVILLCAASNPMYIKRMDVLLGPAFFLLLGMAGAAAYVIKRIPAIGAVLPLGLFIGISLIWSAEGRSFLGEQNPQGWIALENYHIQQLQEADREGRTPVALELADVYEESWMAERIARTLYKHGMISEEPDIKPLSTHELTERFHLRAPVLPWS